VEIILIPVALESGSEWVILNTPKNRPIERAISPEAGSPPRLGLGALLLNPRRGRGAA
jgi:hypothetical protein